ncbi:MAG: hypothetical protein LBU97_00955 [Alistipes sp.]|jgi:hypothetical protein|nr:hypothetical protein [Alistipes sp.]
MKTISKLPVFFFALVLTACQKENTEPNLSEGDLISIVDGMVISPKWLVNEVNRIADTYDTSPVGDKFYPMVYSVKYSGQMYILIFDPLESCGVCGQLFFTLSGEPINPGTYPAESELYNKLEEARRNAVLLWSGLYRPSASTRAWGNTAYVYTPNASLVSDTWNRSEEYTTSASMAAALNDLFLQFPLASTSPNSYATVLSNPTSTYNCHAYAWHMTEGGSRVWMGKYSDPTSAYVQDGSYVPTSSNTPGAKVMYYPKDNHSAIAETSTTFVSKWGMWPLMRHNKNYSPYNSLKTYQT